MAVALCRCWWLCAVLPLLLVAVACAGRLPAVLVVLAVDFAGMAGGSCMALGGTIGGPYIALV